MRRDGSHPTRKNLRGHGAEQHTSGCVLSRSAENPFLIPLDAISISSPFLPRLVDVRLLISSTTASRCTVPYDTVGHEVCRPSGPASAYVLGDAALRHPAECHMTFATRCHPLIPPHAFRSPRPQPLPVCTVRKHACPCTARRTRAADLPLC